MKEEDKSWEEKETWFEKYYWWIVIILVLIVTIFIVVVLNSPKVQAQPTFRNDTGYVQIAHGVASEHVWVYKHAGTPNFVCTDFSFALSQKLSAAGFQVRMKTVKWFDQGNGTCSVYNYKYFRCKHMIVQVKINGKWIPIESTKGEVISPEQYKLFYK